MTHLQRKFGWIPDNPGDDPVFKCEKPRVFFRTMDLRWKDIILPVRDQGQAGSCTGFGVTGIEYSAMKSDTTFNTQPFHPSELFAYWCGRRIKREDEGASIRDVVDATCEYGVAPSHLWLYKESNVLIEPPKRAFEEAIKFKTIKKARVPQNIQDIINILASGYPIVFGHRCHSNFFNVKKDGIVPMPKGVFLGGHCEYWHGYNLNKSFLIGQNSWGVNRGDRGHEYFPFDYVLDPEICMDLWVIYEISI
jgi:C1A family cysteine protease